jgi:hypothetical protein
MPRKVFTAGEVLAAADVNEFLMDQTIMSFAGTAARGSAIGTAVEGMYAHLNDTDTLTYYNGSAWVNRLGAPAGVLQVQQAVKTDTSSTTSQSFADISGLSVSITPSSATSKILVFCSVNTAHTGNNDNTVFVNLIRNSTDISLGSGGDSFNISMASTTNSLQLANLTNFFLDSPATTSAVTYKCAFRLQAASGTGYINRRGADNTYRVPSSITVMEVAG